MRNHRCHSNLSGIVGVVAGVALLVALISPQSAIGFRAPQVAPSDPERLLGDKFQFLPADIAAARSGQPVAKMIAARTRDELAVVGALRLDGDKKRLVDWVRNIAEFRHAAELGLTRALSSPPAIESFNNLSLDAKDLAALQACRPGRCDLRLSDAAMTELQNSVRWDAPDAAAQANAVVGKMLVERAQTYLRGGTPRLATTSATCFAGRRRSTRSRRS